MKYKHEAPHYAIFYSLPLLAVIYIYTHTKKTSKI